MTSEVRPNAAASYPLGAPPIDAIVGSLKYSAAAIVPPCALVKASQRRAWSGRHTWSAPRVPSPVGTEVTMGASTARENSIAAQPLLARQHAAIAFGRVLGRRVRVGEIGRISPGAADSHIGRTERRCHGAQSPVGQVDRWAVLI